METPYEVFEHTADIGLHVFGQTLPDLFVHAAQGMESLMVAPEQVRPITSHKIEVSGHDTLSLMIAWLNEFIYLFDTEYLLFSTFTIDAWSETSLVAHVAGEPYDAQRHALSSAIKAVTWHEAAIMPKDGGYTASLIFDI